MRTLTIMLLALLGTFEVSAGFVELTAEVTSVNDYGTTYRVYASFDHPEDELVAIYSVGSNESNPVGLTTTVTTSFYQDPFGGNFTNALTPFFLETFESLQYDSWLTIGSEDALDSEVSSVDMGSPLADFAAGNGFTMDGGSWYIIPGTNPLAVAGDELRVLVAQFTVTDGGTFALSWNLQWKSGLTGGSFNDLEVTFDSADMAEPVLGCTDEAACNFDAAANTNDGTCIVPNAAECEYCDGLTIAVADSDGDGVCDADEIIGCQDDAACNYDATATDAGSCTYADGNCEVCDGNGGVAVQDADGDGICDADEIAGCQDTAACNFNESATDSDSSSCIFPAGCETCSGATDGTGTIVNNDSDGDGICNDDEIAGCTDDAACNYASAATDNDGSCVFAEGPCDVCDGGTVVTSDADGDGVCDEDEVAGCTDSEACNYNADATDDNGSCYSAPVGLTCEEYCPAGDWDGDGVCDLDEILGCTSTSASNFNAAATDDDGSCVWADGFFQGLTVEQIDQSVLPGQKTFRVYANFNSDNIEVAAAFGTNAHNWSIYSTEPFYQDMLGADFGPNINPITFVVSEGIALDTWLTLGAAPGQPMDFQQAGMSSFFNDFFDFGQNVLVNTEVGATMFYTPGASDFAFPQDGKFLLGQFTTAGVVSLKYNLQFRDPSQNSIQVTDLNITFPMMGPGCMDELACNYDAEATEDDGSCYFAEENYDCDGACLNDADGDGVCDELEVGGCMDAAACNFNNMATDDDGSCLLASGTCEFCDGQGGVEVQDADGDGVCDADEIDGCDDLTACNYDVTATDNDGSCEYPAEFFDCEGGCVNDADGDGVCDELEISGCTDATATNYDPAATDDDGTCSQAGCNILAACNYMENPDEIDNSLCIFPAPFQDCDGNACGGDWDGDGVLEGDEVYGCTSESAGNFNPAATHEDGSCVWDGIFQGLTYEVAAENGVAGQTTYLVYAQFDPSANVDAISVFGNAQDPWVISTTTAFFQAALGVDFGANLNPGLYSFFPILAYDSWITIGAEPGDYNAIAQTGMYDYLDSWNNGGDIVVDTDPGATIFLPENSSNQGYPDEDGRLLLAQLTTDGIVNLQYNITYENAANQAFTITDVELSFPAVAGGCMDPEADNYDATATMDDCSCQYSGCTNAQADNYDPGANVDDGSCFFTGCEDPEADNFWNLANTGDQLALCEYWGCMDPEADNYDTTANMDPNDECEYEGCTEAGACNFDPAANVNDGTCWFADQYYDCEGVCLNDTDGDGICDELEIAGCTDPEADLSSYNPEATDEDGSCLYVGCFDSEADNFNPIANTGSQEDLCQYFGCTDPTADLGSYDSGANVDDGSCLYLGCTIDYADNYDPQATDDDGSCEVEGCMYTNATNYDPNATYDDESNGLACEFGECNTSASCLGDLNEDLSVDVQDLLIFFQQYGSQCME